MALDSTFVLKRARQALRIEQEALEATRESLGPAFVAVARAVHAAVVAGKKLVFTGVGKSAHIAQKLTGTFNSTGAPSCFLDATQALHGDLGMVREGDVALILSNSGQTDEVLKLVPGLRRFGLKLVAFTAKADSDLARGCDLQLLYTAPREACPLALAPTASTTAALALGDALAVALLDARGFGADDFARSHPGGSLGRRLLTHVGDVMRPAPAVPVVTLDAALGEALLAMTRGGMGMTVVADAAGRPLGIFTDGDLRRTLEKGIDVRSARIADVMTAGPRHIGPDALAVEAAEMMERMRISQLLVLDDDGRLAGALTTHDLMLAKVI